MTIRIESFLASAILAALAFSAAGSAGAEPGHGRHRSNEQVQACIAEIGRHADYREASRVVHWVAGLAQKTLVDLEVRIETTVYPDDGDLLAREYRASCVAGAFGKIIEFRIDPVASNTHDGRSGSDQ